MGDRFIRQNRISCFVHIVHDITQRLFRPVRIHSSVLRDLQTPVEEFAPICSGIPSVKNITRFSRTGFGRNRFLILLYNLGFCQWRR